MKTSTGMGAFIFGAAILGGCAASSIQGTQVRVHTTTAAFEQYGPSQQAVVRRARNSGHKESPTAHACKAGSSKACNEIGDRLTIKHAYAEARQWYATSCERVLSAMVPSATRAMQLSQDITRLDSVHSDDEQASAANQKSLVALKNAASELRARIQGCFDTGETLRLDEEPKQSLKYYDAACEFSTLVETVGEALPGFQYVTENGCTGGRSVRAELTGNTQFSPQLFVDLTEQQRQPVAKPSATQSEEGMVFSGAEL